MLEKIKNALLASLLVLQEESFHAYAKDSSDARFLMSQHLFLQLAPMGPTQSQST
jgi:hypothetical protein